MKRALIMVLLLSMAMPFMRELLAAEPVTVLKDLTAVIALLGVPCGTVVSATRRAENDHIATCSNGTRYRLFVNSENRVVAQKQ